MTMLFGNLITVGIYGLAACLSLAVMGATLFRKEGSRRLSGNLLFLVAMLLGWQIVAICFHLCRSERWIRILHHMDLPFVAFSVVAILLYVLRFYSLDVYQTPMAVVLLCVIPATTAILAFTGMYHPYLRTDIAVFFLEDRPVVAAQNGVWFWIHSCYCYALAIAAFLVASTQYRRIPRMYRTPSRWLILGVVAALLGNVVVLLDILPLQVDLSLVGSSICVLFLYRSTRNAQGLDFLNHIRNEVFHAIHKAIFILDDENCIINYNLAAKQMMTRSGVRIGFRKEDKRYDVIIGRLMEGAAAVEDSEAESNGVDYYHPTFLKESIYNVRDKDILDRRGKRIGGIAICTDVTENRSIIRKLEEDSGVDAMTGLFNRHRFVQMVDELDQPHSHPLAVLIGDLNGLKGINDTMGHGHGDLAIRVAAEGLRLCCPAKARITRMGGDEFLALIPNCTEAQGMVLVQRVEEYFTENEVGGMPITMALGVAVRQRADESIGDLIERADAQMYLDKRRKKLMAQVRVSRSAR